MKSYLIGGAALALVSAVALFAWHYLDLRADAAKLPELEREIARQASAMRDSANQIDALTTRLSEIDAKREAAEAALLATTTTIDRMAARTAEELARAIPDDPHCRYPADAGRVLRDQLDGFRGPAD